jgi:predicted component of type VI protein secretion system
VLTRDVRLRYPLRDSRGLLLLAKGAVVTGRLESALRSRGISLELRASLRLSNGHTTGSEIPLVKTPFLIGRRAYCYLRLASPVVSGFHCLIYKRPAGVLLEDLDSDNGTYLNGRRLRGEREVGDDDQLQIGPCRFRVRVFAAVAADLPENARLLRQ